LDLSLILNRTQPPAPWQEAENIPWHEPGFSRRMLQAHLAQDHDMASRRQAVIEQQVAWIDAELLQGRPSRVLDLACGPGLYTAALARRGHTCRGIDFSPASVEYAIETARREGLSAEHVLGDLRTTHYGDGYDLAMFIFGEFNALQTSQAEEVIRRMGEALKPGGHLLLEPHTYEGMKAMGTTPPRWWSSQNGVFADGAYVCLKESFWDEEAQAATDRYFVLTERGVERMAGSYSAYTDEQYVAMIERCGFTEVKLLPGIGEHRQEHIMAITAVRR